MIKNAYKLLSADGYRMLLIELCEDLNQTSWWQLRRTNLIRTDIAYVLKMLRYLEDR